jgi:hypothetical protein
MKNKINYFPLFRRILQSGISKSALVALVKAIIVKYDVHIFSPESYAIHFKGSECWLYLPHCLRISYHTGTPEPHLNSLSFDYESVYFCIWFNAGLTQIHLISFVGIGLNQVPRSKGGLYVQKRKSKTNTFLVKG